MRQALTPTDRTNVTPSSPAAPTRTRILDAAEELMGSIGLVRATTKEIARAAGCSEAALYKHFSSKEELFVAVLQERLPALGPLLRDLMADPGDRGIEECLTEIARSAALFYDASTPIGASLFADPALLRRHRDGLRPMGAGPHQPLRELAAYLRTERAHGRIHPDANPDAAAALLLGACFQRAFLRHFLGEAPEPADAFATALARTLLAGIGR
ncbi:AcrR family transcriptional regulator [Streptacidiphilus sp. MAP12-16]|uniref:TetR/AcrR family transcriptional regulator n=1 Tax=Streptacidiphilus sp. MAP12-16 TaxID=3156300 RepID=UPI003515703B